ncbi:sensor histidine kinase [Paenibacillus piri]|uniref:Sensor histidine kinase n=1 Tax=Paenibacillus piri TaxID=2547395 RepID=A0A4R5KX39_9BACL|nr:sensor histidine kinase [Paenibacillus piri]TDG00594.1 sensor histidine kinase [Paenibacillus piri]
MLRSRLQRLRSVWRHRAFGIQWKIFASFGLITVIAVALVGAGAYYYAAETIKQNAVASITDSIEHANDNLQMMLDDMDKISTVVVENKEIVAGAINSGHTALSYEWFMEKKRVDEWLSTLSAYKTYISGMTVIGANGKRFAADGKQQIGIDPEVFRRIIGQNKKSIHLVAGVPVIGRPIYLSGQPVGIVAVAFNPAVLSKLFSIQPLADSNIAVIDRSGDIVFQSQPTSASNVIEPSSIAEAAGKQKERPGSRMIDVGGRSYLAVDYTSAFTEWTTIGMIPENTLLQKVYHIRRLFMMISVAILLAVLLLSMQISNHITKNLRQLRNAMRLVSQGHLLAKPKIYTKDEVGQLNVIFSSMMDNIQSLMRDIELRERQKRRAQLQALQNQVAPHFLCNTLNVIHYLAEIQHAYNIKEVSGALIDLMRETLDSGREFITIAEELEYAQKYLSIQKYKFLDQLAVTVDVEPGIESCLTPKMILQPIVENSIKHGLGSLPRRGMISIKIYAEGADIKYAVTDNGVGMNEEQMSRIMSWSQAGPDGVPQRETVHSLSEEPGGIGLRNVHERIVMYYGERYGLAIFSDPGLFTTVEISIPLCKGETYEAERAYCG